MPVIKIYKCCICHEVLEDYKPIRLTRQKYGMHHRNQYSPVANYASAKDVMQSLIIELRRMR